MLQHKNGIKLKSLISLYRCIIQTTKPQYKAKTIMSNYSFYVPRMLAEYDDVSVKGIITNYFAIGVVNRVDFVPIEGESRYQKAFIHMYTIYDNANTTHIINEVFNNEKNVRVYPNQYTSNEYWILLKNTKPVSETKLNIHQVVENANILQSVVEAQALEIKTLREEMLKLTEIMNTINVV